MKFASGVILCALAALCLVDGGSAYMSRRYRDSLGDGIRAKTQPMVANDEGVLSHYYHDQLLDHFDALNTQTWTQRYWINDTFFNNKDGDAPVFLCVGEFWSCLRLSVGDCMEFFVPCHLMFCFPPHDHRWRDSSQC